MKRSKVLFISNGHGEDTVSSYIVQELLKRDPGVEALAFPLVGTGDIFRRRGMALCGPSPDAPHHGFSLHKLHMVGRLLRGNFLLVTPGQRAIAARLRGQCDLAVAVGDGIPALLAKWLKLPFIFVGVNKTQHYQEYGRRYLIIERRLLRRACVVFTRDALTARALEAKGLTNVAYAGNPMMDCVTDSEERVIDPRRGRLVCLLPGSYQDVYLNMEDLLRVAGKLGRLATPREGLQFAFAAPAQVTRETAARQSFTQWTFESHSAANGAALLGVWRNGATQVQLFNLGFWEILSASDMVIGLAGTANEQAAGLGKPIVSFPSRGVQYTRYFGKNQQELLGQALAFLPGGPDGVAEKAWQILNCPSTCRRMADAGRERMEKRGAVGAIAETILQILDRLRGWRHEPIPPSHESETTTSCIPR